MDYKIKPWAHQLKAIEAAKDVNNFALLFDVGTGKSLTQINILRHKYKQHNQILPTLILCPLIVMENWKRELLANSNILPLKILTLTGTGLQRAQALKEMMGKDRNTIVIANYESLAIDKVFAALVAWAPQAIVCDESHQIKNLSSKRTKRVIALGDLAKYRYIMSGTPVLNTPMDLFAQYRFLDRGASFGSNYFTFRGTYFYDKNAGMPPTKYFPNWQIKPGSLETFNTIIHKTGMVAKKSECLDLPPLVRKPIYVELSTEQKRLYLELKKDLVTFLNDKACTAPLAITKSLRLQQIVSGYVVGEDLQGEKSEIILKENPRADALKDLLEDLAPNHKVIIWAVFKNNYETIRGVCEKLGVKYVEVHGGIATKDKFSNVDAFNTAPDCRVLIGHPGSGGIGINLVASSVSIFYSRNFSLGQDLQAEARNYRGGSEIHESILRIDLITKDTIDEVIQTALANKQEISDKLLREYQSSL